MGRSERPLEGVLIGYGLIAEGHLAGYACVRDLVIRTVVEPNADRRALARHALPGAAVVATIDDIDLARHDFVDICAPPSAHLEYATRALDADVAILCEKPLVANTSELQALEEAEKRSSAFVYPCHNYVFAPSVQRLLGLLPRLRPAGEVIRGHFRTLRVGHARGAPEWNPDWRRDIGLAGGGILQDHGPHSIYLAIRAVGAPVVGVRARVMRPPSGPFNVSEDIAYLALRFEDGSTVTMELDWSSDIRQTSYLIDTARGYVRVLDSRITAHGPGLEVRELLDSEFDDPRHATWFGSLLQHFRMAFDDRSQAVKLRREASEVVEIIAAAYRSSAADGAAVYRSDWDAELNRSTISTMQASGNDRHPLQPHLAPPLM